MTSVKRLLLGTVKQIVNNCCIPGVESTNAILHVKCPYVCGKPSHFENRIHQNIRISGGKKATSGSHPWLVSLHLNGTFLCGGSIIEQKWVKIDSSHLTRSTVQKMRIFYQKFFQILTAAHCLIVKRNNTVAQYDYMDVRAGILRQNSFTPHEQTVRVLRVFMHSGFDLKSKVFCLAMMTFLLITISLSQPSVVTSLS